MSINIKMLRFTVFCVQFQEKHCKKYLERLGFKGLF